MNDSSWKRLLVVLFVVAMMGMDCAVSRAASGSGIAATPGEVGIVTPGAFHPVGNAFLGANIDGAYNPNGSFQWNEQRTIAGVKALGLQSLRYPGGTDSNYFDWHTGWVYPKFSTNAGPFDQTLKNFAPLAKLTGPPVFDLNVMTYNNAIATPAQNGVMVQDQIAMLKAAQQLGMPIDSIELGNELYFAVLPNNPDGVSYAQRFSSGVAYAKEMNFWIGELKAAFPQAKIAVVEQSFQGGSWNDDVMANIGKADAVTLHYYQIEKDGGQDPVVLLSKAFTKWKSFRTDRVAPVAANGMSVWMTEFDFVDHTADMAYASMWFHGLFDAEMLLQFLSEPAIEKVDIYNFHSQSKRSSLVYDGAEKFGAHGAIATQAGTFSASGQVVALFGKALRGATSVAPVTVSGLAPVSPGTNGVKFTPYPAVSGVVVGYGATGGVGFLLTNLSAQPVALSCGSGVARMQSLSAAGLATNVVTATAVTASARQISLKEFVVPAYSVNYIGK